MDENVIADLIFSGLHPHFMAMITVLLSGIYVFKYMCTESACFGRRRPIYLLRAFLWFLFAASWAAFPYLDVLVARSMLRAMVAIIVLVEVAYNILYINDAARETWRWISKK